ncbi:MAG: hypothetical protein WAO36_00460 [Candidatus Methanoculleus thermohydrogenotrophicum]|jgi:hypothetical protein|nr:hypothetical protein [Candidatus Methanoculleus thermohydrogenotrophicum]
MPPLLHLPDKILEIMDMSRMINIDNDPHALTPAAGMIEININTLTVDQILFSTPHPPEKTRRITSDTP